MARPFLSVIIPAYNDAHELPLTLIDIDRYLSAQRFSYEIVVVNDGSRDATSEITKRFSQAIRNLKVIDAPERRGHGAAVRIGALASKGNWRLVMGSENRIPVSEFGSVETLLGPAKQIDIIIASRGAGDALSLPRRTLFRAPIGHFLMNAFIRQTFRSRVQDFFLDFHCFSAESAEKIFSLTKLNSAGYAAEALIIGERLRYRIQEVSVTYPPAFVRSINYLRVCWETIKIWWWLKRNRYQLEGVII